MRSPRSFNASFVISTCISVASHGVVIVAGLWLEPRAAPPARPAPVFDEGENAVTIVWRSPIPQERVPEPDPPVPERVVPVEEALPAEPDPAPSTEPQTETEPAAGTEPERELEPRTEAEPETESKPSTKTGAAAQSEPETDTGAEPEPESESRPNGGSETEIVPAASLSRSPLESPPADVEATQEETPSGGEPGIRTEAELTTRLAPHYPRSCRRRGHEGTVRLECRLDASGKVISVRVLSSSGCMKLDRAALDAVRRAGFEPARAGGEPVATTVILPIEFRLR